MLRTLGSLTALFASLALLISGGGMLGTLLPFRLTLEDYNPWMIGLILVFYSFGFVAGTLTVMPIIRRVGHIRSFAVLAAVTCATVLIHPLFVYGPAWAVLRFITGYCLAGLIMIMESWVNALAAPAYRATLLGLYTAAFYLFGALGQILFGYSVPEQFSSFSLVAILVVLSLVPLGLTRLQAPALTQTKRLRMGRLYRQAPLGLAGALVGGISLSAFMTLGPVFGNLNGWDAAGVSVFMTAAVVAAMALQWPAGRLTDLFDRRRVFLGLAATATLTALLTAMATQFVASVIYALSALSIGVCACFYPISLAIVCDRLESQDLLAASAGLLFIYGLGTCIGPLGAAAGISLLGPAGLFVFIGAGLLVFCVYGVWRIDHSADIPIDEQVHFVAIAAESTPVITELDPRTEDDGPGEQTTTETQGD